MKEQRITIEIDQNGRISAEAEGFSGHACLKDLDLLLEGLAPGKATLVLKTDPGATHVAATHTQGVGKKS